MYETDKRHSFVEKLQFFVIIRKTDQIIIITLR